MAEEETPGWMKQVLNPSAKGEGGPSNEPAAAARTTADSMFATKDSPAFAKLRGEMAAGLWGKDLQEPDAIDGKLKELQDRETEARRERLAQNQSQGRQVQNDDLNYFLPEDKKLPATPPVQDVTPPQKPQAPQPIGSEQPAKSDYDPKISSWMNKDPLTWWPRDYTEKTRFRKTLTNPELVEYTKLSKEASDWHLKTRNGAAPAYTFGLPEYRDFRKRYDEFYNRTVPRWRALEKKNPPRRYRPRSAVSALGGMELDVG